MPSLRTEVSEIITGLGMLGFADLDSALAAMPSALDGVDADRFARIRAARHAGEHAELFNATWLNGQRFSRSPEGLRGRPPWLVEWLGPHQPTGRELLPADLRVDHVYLISCKYGSDILLNSAPTQLFDHRLEHRSTGARDWFEDVAPDALQSFYRLVVDHLDARSDLPPAVGRLERHHRQLLKAALPRRWPAELEPAWRSFAIEVAEASAARWQSSLGSERHRHEMLWRLLRLQPGPYFVLGSSRRGHPIAIRTLTPFDHRRRFTVESFDISAQRAGQPSVGWSVTCVDADGLPHAVEGHVEVRWSHGRFGGRPEAKVYLDTQHDTVPGYVSLSSGTDESDLRLL